jgi:hypothetical protein
VVADVYIPIRRALEAHLGTFGSIPSGGIQYENALFDTPEQEIYFRTKVDFNQPVARTFGTGATSRLGGLFVIDVFGPAGVGTGTLEALADDLLNHFYSGQVLTYNTHNVVLFVPWRESGVTGETWYFIPCFMPWIYRTDKLSEA